MQDASNRGAEDTMWAAGHKIVWRGRPRPRTRAAPPLPLSRASDGIH